MVHDEAFKDWFKRRRKSLDLTQEELAAQVHCSLGKREREFVRATAYVKHVTGGYSSSSANNADCGSPISHGGFPL